MLIFVIASLTALAAGATGTWSPCGMSMVETLAFPRSGGRWRTVLSSCVTFAVGTLVGSIVTFGALALAGYVLKPTGIAIWTAAAVAVIAAWCEFRGTRIAPQVRRQVPEQWRRVMPLPIASGGYGFLLGLGFTTFVLTYGVWVLAFMCLAVGSPALGVTVGISFAVGRMVPVVALTITTVHRGRDAVERLETRPTILAVARRIDGLLLACLAACLVLFTPSTALSQQQVTASGYGPSVLGDLVVWTSDGLAVSAPSSGLIDGAQMASAGGGNLAIVRDGVVVVFDLADSAMPVIAEIPIGQSVTGLAVSSRWVTWRTSRPAGGDEVLAYPLHTEAATVRGVIRSAPTVDISRPALSGDRMAFALSTPRQSRIVITHLATGKTRVVIGRGKQLREPSLHNNRLMYVTADYCRQQLVIRHVNLRNHPRTILQRSSGTMRDAGYERHRTRQGSEASGCPRLPGGQEMLGETALSGMSAFVTLTRWDARGNARARIIRVPLRGR